jgi:hypothetical protein
MRSKLYVCSWCKRSTPGSIYIRIAANLCGVRQARRLRLHRAFPRGHCCVECFPIVLQTLLERQTSSFEDECPAVDSSLLKSVCKEFSDLLQGELASGSMEPSAGNGADRPATQTADRTTGLVSAPAGAEKTGSLSPADQAGERAGGKRV